MEEKDFVISFGRIQFGKKSVVQNHVLCKKTLCFINNQVLVQEIPEASEESTTPRFIRNANLSLKIAPGGAW